MSHSKMTKRGRSLYIESWNPSAQKYINTCSLCGRRGYSPAIEEADFTNPLHKIGDLEWAAIYRELTKILKPLPLDANGRCADCAIRMNRL